MEKFDEITNPAQLHAASEDDEEEKLSSHPDYLHHYVAFHKDSISVVVIVLWRSGVPGSLTCYDGKPVLYYHHQRRAIHVPNPTTWVNYAKEHGNSPTVQDVDYSDEALHRAKGIDAVISKHQTQLFADHSNLVAVRPSVHGEAIEFVVMCKNFIPVGENPLPIKIGSIQTSVCSGWFEMCGFHERRERRPVPPGAGFAAEQDAELNLGGGQFDYKPPALCTLGGWFVENDDTIYGVSCGHCVADTGGNVYPSGTTIHQPCAMGLVINAASYDCDVMDAYDVDTRKIGHFDAMTTVINKIEKFSMNTNTALTAASICGELVNGVCGAFQTYSAMDVGVIKMNSIEECQMHIGLPEELAESPNLVLGKGGTQILAIDEFPNEPFDVFGKGARSAGMMRAVINPLQRGGYFRTVEFESGLIFRCIVANAGANWNPGDSGTWIWTNPNEQIQNGKLVGMGIGVLIGPNNENCCCMLPMDDVENVVKSLIHNAT
jgi:hypothetical protein